ncbi:MAG: hypothetical protein Q9190_005115 [Brigantiaea leucoxantha]
MKYKQKSIFAGGWTAEKQRQLDSAKLPDKTKCNTCKKIKAISHFSNKQQSLLRDNIARVGERARTPTAETITCRTCVGSQVHELRCMICDEVKGLHAFAKAQRKDPDTAARIQYTLFEN